MKFSLSLALAALSAAAGSVNADCRCTHSGDAARWIDSHSPRNAAALILNAGNGLGCYRATVQGNMCIRTTNGNLNNEVKLCLGQEAAADESYHGDWFLWNIITCEANGASLQLTITG